jgi:hypothetical protein
MYDAEGREVREGATMTALGTMSDESSHREYQGLLRIVRRIAEHPDYPGKRDVIEECVLDIVERSRQGRLSPVQRAELLQMLRSGRGGAR